MAVNIPKFDTKVNFNIFHIIIEWEQLQQNTQLKAYMGYHSLSTVTYFGGKKEEKKNTITDWPLHQKWILPQNVSKHKWKLALHITLSKYWSVYRKASSRGAYGHDPFWSVFEEQRLDSTTTDITTALFILLIMSLYYLILWNQVDILQKHFKKDHVHMRLWTRFYGISKITLLPQNISKHEWKLALQSYEHIYYYWAPYYKEVGLIIRLIKL